MASQYRMFLTNLCPIRIFAPLDAIKIRPKLFRLACRKHLAMLIRCDWTTFERRGSSFPTVSTFSALAIMVSRQRKKNYFASS